MTKYVSSSNGKKGPGRRRGLQKGVHPNVESEKIRAGKFIVKGVVQGESGDSGLSTSEPERPCGQSANVTTSRQVPLPCTYTTTCKMEADVSDETIKSANPSDVVRLEIVVGNSRNSTVTVLRHWSVKTLKKRIKEVHDKASGAFSRRVLIPGSELAITHLLANLPPLEDEYQLKSLPEGWEDRIYEAVPKRAAQ